jgi:hypothetical protein
MVPAGETRKETFRRLATRRTNAVLNRLRVLGHCSNRHLYEYDQEDVKKIFRAIDAELRIVKAKFRNSDQSDFKL